MPAPESKLDRFGRLLSALEQLASQASFLLGKSQVDLALDCQARAEPLVADLAALADALRAEGRLAPPLLTRARSLLERQQRIQLLVTQGLEAARGDLEGAREASARLRRIRPAYGSALGAYRNAPQGRRLDSSG